MQRKMQASPSPAEEVVDLREYAAVLRRRKWLILVITGFFTALMGAYSFSKAPMYTAQSTVYVQPASTSAQFRPDQLVSLDTESRLVKSAPVAIIAQGMLSWDLTIPQLLKRVSVETTPDTLVLDIFFTDGQRNDAAEGANAFAKAYLQYKQDRAIASAGEARAGVQTLIDEQTKQRDKLDRDLQSLTPGTIEYQDAGRERDNASANIAVLQSQLASISTASDPGEIILPAEPPTSPSSPKHVLDIAMGFLFGAFLGVVLAFIRDRTDERITGRADLEMTLDAPVLAAIPRVAGWKKRGPVWLVTERQPRSPAAEAYRTLRTGVMAMARRRDLKVFAVVSPVQGEGKTTTAANLAVTLSHTDSRVLVIGADLRRPSLHRYFQLENEMGLSDVLLGEVPLEEAIQAVSPNLWVLVSGQPPARPAELLQSHRMAELLDRQRDRFDFILLDCPPVLGLADSMAIAPLADAMLLVAKAEKTKRGAIAHAVDQLGQVGAAVRGGVLNNVSLSKRHSSYGYGMDTGTAWTRLPKRRKRGRRRASTGSAGARHLPTATGTGRETCSLAPPQARRCRRGRRPSNQLRHQSPARAQTRDAQRTKPMDLLVCSPGGHLTQLYNLKGWWDRIDRVWVTFDKPDATSLLAGESIIWAYHPTTRNLRNLLRNFGLARRTVGRLRPDVVVSTGAAVAFPFFLVGEASGSSHRIRGGLRQDGLLYHDRPALLPDQRPIPPPMGRAEGDVSKGRGRGTAVVSGAKGVGEASDEAVFVTVGTDHHPFDRLIGWVDSWLANGSNGTEAFVQYGTSQPPRVAAGKEYLPHDEMDRRIASAKAIVCHGGPGTIIDCMRSGTKPIVVPRRHALGEHVDDHQVRFTRRLEEAGYIKVAADERQLGTLLRDALDGSPYFVARETDDTVQNTVERFAGDRRPAAPPDPRSGYGSSTSEVGAAAEARCWIDCSDRCRVRSPSARWGSVAPRRPG